MKPPKKLTKKVLSASTVVLIKFKDGYEIVYNSALDIPKQTAVFLLTELIKELSKP